MKRARRRERGWALVSVLWVVAILAMLAAATEALTVTVARAGYSADLNAGADADLDAGMARAVVAIADKRASQRWRVDGTPQDFDFDGAHLRIAIQDELGRIDLNAADVSMIKRLLISAGVGDDDADALADKIADWRSRSGLKSLHGADAADYAAAGYAYRPRGGPFASVDEVRLVMGMTPQIFARIRPALTVYSKRPALDPNVAPREALAALYLGDEDKIGAALAARDAARGAEGPAEAVSGDLGFVPAGRAFSISIRMVKDGRRYARDVVVLLTGDDKRPYIVLAWG